MTAAEVSTGLQRGQRETPSRAPGGPSDDPLLVVEAGGVDSHDQKVALREPFELPAVIGDGDEKAQLPGPIDSEVLERYRQLEHAIGREGGRRGRYALGPGAAPLAGRVATDAQSALERREELDRDGALFGNAARVRCGVQAQVEAARVVTEV